MIEPWGTIFIIFAAKAGFWASGEPKRDSEAWRLRRPERSVAKLVVAVFENSPVNALLRDDCVLANGFPLALWIRRPVRKWLCECVWRRVRQLHHSHAVVLGQSQHLCGAVVRVPGHAQEV